MLHKFIPKIISTKKCFSPFREICSPRKKAPYRNCIWWYINLAKFKVLLYNSSHDWRDFNLVLLEKIAKLSNFKISTHTVDCISNDIYASQMLFHNELYINITKHYINNS